MRPWKRESLNQQIWNTIKTFRASGRPWIQFQKFRIRGVEGVAVVDAFDQVNQEYQQLTRYDIKVDLFLGHGLFIAVGSKEDACHQVEPLVTDWITDEADIEALAITLACYFDLYAYIAIDNQYNIDTIHKRDQSPLLLDAKVSLGCWKRDWNARMHRKYPNARSLWCRCETQYGIKKMLTRRVISLC